MSDEEIDRGRRRLALATVAGAAGVALGKARPVRADAPLRDEVPLAELDALATGEPVPFAYPTPADEGFLVKLGRAAEGGVGPDGDIVAFLRACPHMGCPIRRIDVERAVCGPCSCHRSRFDIAAGGRQIVGRAAQRLVQVELGVRGSTVVAVGVAELPFGHALVREP